jgi:hypothetical protein
MFICRNKSATDDELQWHFWYFFLFEEADVSVAEIRNKTGFNNFIFQNTVLKTNAREVSQNS